MRISWMCGHLRSGVGLLALFVCVAGVYAQEQDLTLEPYILDPDVTVTAQTTPLCPFQQKLDSQFEGSVVASDGKVYFASSTTSDNAAGMFFQYDPATGAVTSLGDFSGICNEDPAVHVPQGKVHSPILEHNGWLYSATCFANHFDEARELYTGAHAWGYQLGSHEAGDCVFRDFGAMRSHYSCYSSVAVDRVNDYFYAWGVPQFGDEDGSHMYRWDIPTGTKTDLGAVVPQASASNGMFVDQRGDAWFTVAAKGGALYKITGSTGEITCYPGALPTGTFWRWGATVDGDRFVFNQRYSNSLYLFDASRMADGDAGDAFTFVHDIGRVGLAMALGGERVYFVRSPNPEMQQPSDNPAKASDHHLYSVTLDPNDELIDHGRIVDQDGRTPWRCEGVSADDAGHVYLTGDWRLNEDELGTEVGTLKHDGVFGSDVYWDMWRGQFFGVVSGVPEPAISAIVLFGAVALIRRRPRRR